MRDKKKKERTAPISDIATKTVEVIGFGGQKFPILAVDGPALTGIFAGVKPGPVGKGVGGRKVHRRKVH